MGRSMDNGKTWQSADVPGSQDGYADALEHGLQDDILTHSLTHKESPFLYSPESDGTHWSTYAGGEFKDGPLNMAFDAVHG